MLSVLFWFCKIYGDCNKSATTNETSSLYLANNVAFKLRSQKPISSNDLRPHSLFDVGFVDTHLPFSHLPTYKTNIELKKEKETNRFVIRLMLRC